MAVLGMSVQQAIEEAHRCLLCHDAPCSQGCPGGTDPAKFIRQIRFYNLKGAARTVLGNNPLGGVCAHVCPTDETCVRECVRAGMDRPIDIDGLQAFAVDYGRRNGLTVLTAGEPRDQKVAIIGAGPAGLAAAAQLAREGYRVTVFEARKAAGGMLRYGVPASRLPDALLDADLDEITALGVKLKLDKKLKGEDAGADLLKKGYDAVFVATGLWKPYKLDLPGIEQKGVSNALKFLDRARHKPAKARKLVEGRNVAIIGGGSVAMDVARCARELGADRIYAIALEGPTELPAQTTELAEAQQDGVIIMPYCKTTEILGDGEVVTGLCGVETEWILPGNLRPDNAREVDGTSWQLKVGAVIQAIGQGPTGAAQGLVASATKEGWMLKVDDLTQATSLDRIFGGGDIARGASTVVAAVGDGKRAAAAIHELLSKEVV
jgi:dihydropyrimidine dehydrogenase (NAD+) subunit PreT